MQVILLLSIALLPLTCSMLSEETFEDLSFEEYMDNYQAQPVKRSFDLPPLDVDFPDSFEDKPVSNQQKRHVDPFLMARAVTKTVPEVKPFKDFARTWQSENKVERSANEGLGMRDELGIQLLALLKMLKEEITQLTEQSTPSPHPPTTELYHGPPYSNLHPVLPPINVMIPAPSIQSPQKKRSNKPPQKLKRPSVVANVVEPDFAERLVNLVRELKVELKQLEKTSLEKNYYEIVTTLPTTLATTTPANKKTLDLIKSIQDRVNKLKKYEAQRAFSYQKRSPRHITEMPKPKNGSKTSNHHQSRKTQQKPVSSSYTTTHKKLPVLLSKPVNTMPADEESDEILRVMIQNDNETHTEVFAKNGDRFLKRHRYDFSPGNM